MYDDCSSSLRLWYPELTSIRDKYVTLVRFGTISLRVGPQWTGCMSAWLSSGSKHNLNFQFGIDTRTKWMTHPWMTFVMYKLHTLTGPGMVCCLILSVMRIFHWGIQSQWIHLWTRYVIVAWSLHLPFYSFLLGSWNEIVYFAINVYQWPLAYLHYFNLEYQLSFYSIYQACLFPVCCLCIGSHHPSHSKCAYFLFACLLCCSWF